MALVMCMFHNLQDDDGRTMPLYFISSFLTHSYCVYMTTQLHSRRPSFKSQIENSPKASCKEVPTAGRSFWDSFDSHGGIDCPKGVTRFSVVCLQYMVSLRCSQSIRNTLLFLGYFLLDMSCLFRKVSLTCKLRHRIPHIYYMCDLKHSWQIHLLPLFPPSISPCRCLLNGTLRKLASLLHHVTL